MFEQFRKDVNVTRAGTPTNEDLVWVYGADSEFIIKASVQPTPAEVMETLPEGYRTRSSYTLYTDTKLQTSKVGGFKPDAVLLDGEKFLVLKVAPWQNNLINHYEIIVVKGESDVD